MKSLESEVALFLSDGTFFRTVQVSGGATVAIWDVYQDGWWKVRHFEPWNEDVGGVSYVERPA